MSKPRTQTHNKDLLLRAVQANPGLFMSELAKLTGLPAWTVHSIVPELAGRRLINYRIDNPNDVRRKRWYPAVPMDSVDSSSSNIEIKSYTILRRFIGERVLGEI